MLLHLKIVFESLQVDPGDLQTTLSLVRSQYPGNALLWMKDAASYFNLRLNSEQTLDLSNPFVSQPLSLLTRETRRVLTGLYEECGDSAREAAFDNILANMAHDMAKSK